MDKVHYLSFLKKKKNWLKNNKLKIENVFQFLCDSKYNSLYHLSIYIFISIHDILSLCNYQY